MDRMYERRCCGFDADDGTECSDCNYIGTYFDCDVYLADRGKTILARESSELTDVLTISTKTFQKLVGNNEFQNEKYTKAITMACSQMFIERIDTYFNLIDLFYEIEATQEDE